jgi:hypothetical protein
MKQINALSLIFFITLLIAGPAWASSDHSGHASEGEGARQDVLYTCNCGAECNCNTVSTQPGKCKCGVEMKWGHVLKIEGNEAILCQCGEGCKCGGLDAKDPTKCVCGMPVKRVNLEGTGVYFCNCGGSCYCNTVSDKPGKCRCGMELKSS